MVLVNTKELAEQTIEALCEFSNLTRDDIGFIGSGRFELKPISIGILQTITRLEGEEHAKVRKYFGQVVADETHIIAAETYFEAMGKLPAKYKWGYSATPERMDGLTNVIFWATGPLIYKVPDEAVAHKLIIPSYRQIQTEYYFPLIDTSEYQTMITHMANDPERNKLIVDEYKKNEEVPSVFLCNRTDQVEALHEMLPESIMLTSSMSKKKREAAMKDLISGEKKDVVSTWGLFSTGINVPKLAGLYICSPMKSKTKLKQAAGRLMRQAPGKEEAFIVDFVDTQIGLLYGQSRTRKRILTNL
jgi:superfamily II DNA or RNA helicase